MDARKGAAPSLPWLIAGIIATFAGLALCAAVFERAAPLPALGGCPQPAPLEHLHVVVVDRGGKPQVIDCMYVTGRTLRR